MRLKHGARQAARPADVLAEGREALDGVVEEDMMRGMMASAPVAAMPMLAYDAGPAYRLTLH